LQQRLLYRYMCSVLRKKAINSAEDERYGAALRQCCNLADTGGRPCHFIFTNFRAG
jgi:hypothetical protein